MSTNGFVLSHVRCPWILITLLMRRALLILFSHGAPAESHGGKLGAIHTFILLRRTNESQKKFTAVLWRILTKQSSSWNVLKMCINYGSDLFIPNITFANSGSARYCTVILFDISAGFGHSTYSNVDKTEPLFFPGKSCSITRSLH